MNRLSYWQKQDRIIGLIVIGVILFFLQSGAIYLWKLKFSSWQDIIVQFNDLGNLKLENDVKIMGVRVGNISKVIRDDKKEKAILTLTINKDIKLYSDYKILNEDVGLMGDRIISIVPGKSNEPIDPGDTLIGTFKPGIAQGISKAIYLKAAIDSIQQSLITFVDGDGVTHKKPFIEFFKYVVFTVDSIGEAAEKMVSENSPKWQKLLFDIKDVTSEITKLTTELSPSISLGVDTVSVLISKVNSLLTDVDPYIDSVQNFLSTVDNGENFIGKLIKNENLYKDLTLMLEKLQGILQLTREKKAQIPINIHFGRKHSKKTK